MKPRLVEMAAERLATAASDAPLRDEELLRVLARVARAGKLADRVRAVELIARLNQARGDGPDLARLSDDERAERRRT